MAVPFSPLPSANKPQGVRVTPASPLFLREDEIRRGIELLYFGYTAMIRGADAILEQQGLGRAHHRALYFIARRPGLSVGQLLGLLGITKQSLGRVLTDLSARGLVEQAVGHADRRQRLLSLTPDGAALEARLFTELERSMARAYGEAGQQAVTGFWAVLMGLVPPEARAEVEALQG
ncbi:MarR family winged helix-turn-helix transcriptional regulator [Sandarakinorhabdus rubra]|uniref:MarR family winged helix-turn-helix transcriptional regulator n=1 Tax=Sandarakinorhabdus rubra TaxID=2672568 RepID=UPI0013DCDAB2|nr:MarR family transcriptional regulator [Sandarakinorhabdus rubra]